MDMDTIKEFVKLKHLNQKRIQGTPYYLHPFAVADLLAQKGYGIAYQISGLFHDLLEDTDTTYEELVHLSNDAIAEVVRLVTKEKNYEMADYISRIEQNEMAKMVKLADRVHNLSEAHFASEKWIKKYIIETDKWYVDLARDTPFEEPITSILRDLKRKVKYANVAYV